MQRVLDSPSFNFGVFAFLLHFPWELYQLPLFAGFENAPYFTTLVHCTRAALGDVVISLIALAIASVAVRSRFWFLEGNRIATLSFFAVGLIITVGFEAVATLLLDRWQYNESMPILPLTGTGLSPVAQWIIIPWLQLWFVRRQLASSH